MFEFKKTHLDFVNTKMFCFSHQVKNRTFKEMEYLVVNYIKWKILGYTPEFKKLRKMLACPSGSLSSENKWKKLSSMCDQAF